MFELNGRRSLRLQALKAARVMAVDSLLGSTTVSHVRVIAGDSCLPILTLPRGELGCRDARGTPLADLEPS